MRIKFDGALFHAVTTKLDRASKRETKKGGGRKWTSNGHGCLESCRRVSLFSRTRGKRVAKARRMIKRADKTAEWKRDWFKAFRQISMAISSKIPGYTRTFGRGRGCGSLLRTVFARKRELFKTKNHAEGTRRTEGEGGEWGFGSMLRWAREKFACNCVCLSAMRVYFARLDDRTNRISCFFTRKVS